MTCFDSSIFLLRKLPNSRSSLQSREAMVACSPVVLLGILFWFTSELCIETGASPCSAEYCGAMRRQVPLGGVKIEFSLGSPPLSLLCLCMSLCSSCSDNLTLMFFFSTWELWWVPPEESFLFRAPPENVGTPLHLSCVIISSLLKMAGSLMTELWSSSYLSRLCPPVSPSQRVLELCKSLTVIKRFW